MRAAADLFPDVAIYGRKGRIPLRLQVDLRDQQPIRGGHCLPIDIGSYHDNDLRHAAPQRIAARDAQRSLYACGRDRPGSGKAPLATHYDIGAADKRLADREIRLASHHHRLAHRNPAEMGEVRPEAPRQAAAPPDHAVLGDSRDQNKHRGSGLRCRDGGLAGHGVSDGVSYDDAASAWVMRARLKAKIEKTIAMRMGMKMSI